MSVFVSEIGRGHYYCYYYRTCALVRNYSRFSITQIDIIITCIYELLHNYKI
jgi:hypothetical protein